MANWLTLNYFYVLELLLLLLLLLQLQVQFQAVFLLFLCPMRARWKEGRSSKFTPELGGLYFSSRWIL